MGKCYIQVAPSNSTVVFYKYSQSFVTEITQACLNILRVKSLRLSSIE